MSEVTQADLRYAQEAITLVVTNGFKSVNERLDKMDVRVNETALETARHDERLKTLEEAAKSSPGKGQTLALGGAVSGLLYAGIEALKKWFAQ